MKTIPVIDRELGAGGGILAGKPAARRGWKLPGQDLTREIARRANIPPEVGARQRVGDEKKAGELVDNRGEERRKFIQHPYGREWTNRHFFHAGLNPTPGDGLTGETILNLLNAVNQGGEAGRL
jgi:hypothetical protein